MPSTNFVALHEQLDNLKHSFIVEALDELSYTADDHRKASAFCLLASAALEQYVEQRAVQIAQVGSERLKTAQPTTTGRAMVIWHAVRNQGRHIPTTEADLLALSDLVDSAMLAFKKMTDGNHGINGKDFLKLVYPLGIRDHEVPTVLVEALNSISSRRDPTSHVYINRARRMSEPIAEWRAFEQILPLLEQIDVRLDAVANSFPP